MATLKYKKKKKRNTCNLKIYNKEKSSKVNVKLNHLFTQKRENLWPSKH